MTYAPRLTNTLREAYGDQLGQRDVEHIVREAQYMLKTKERHRRLTAIGSLTTSFENASGAVVHALKTMTLDLLVWRHSEHRGDFYAVVLDFDGRRVLVDWTGPCDPPADVTDAKWVRP